MFNSTTARLGVVNPDLKPLPPSTLQCAYGQRYYKKLATQLNSEDDVLKKKTLQELLTLLKSPQNCVEAFHAGVLDVLLRGIEGTTVELRGSVVEVLQQYLLSSAGRCIFQKPPALLALSKALFPLLHDDDLSIRRTVMDCIRLVATDKDSALFLSSSGLVLDLLIQTAWTSAGFYTKERLQELCRLSIDKRTSTTFVDATALPKQGEEASLEGCRPDHRADATKNEMLSPKTKGEGESNFSSDSQSATKSSQWGREETLGQNAEMKEPESPPTYSKTPITTTPSFENRKQRPSWRALRARRVPRRQWVACVRSIRVNWGYQTKKFTFYQTLARQDTDAHACTASIDSVAGFGAASGSILSGRGRATHSASAAATAGEGGDSTLPLPTEETAANVRQTGCCAASAQCLRANRFNKSTSRTLTGHFACSPFSSWKHLRSRKQPRRRWVATERAARVKWGRNPALLRYSVGLHQQDEIATRRDVAAVAETILSDRPPLPPQNCQEKLVGNVAQHPLSQESHAMWSSAGTKEPSCSTVYMMQHCTVDKQGQIQEGSFVEAFRCGNAGLAVNAKEAAVSEATGAGDKMMAQDDTTSPVRCGGEGKDFLTMTLLELSTSGGVSLHDKAPCVREKTGLLVSVHDSLENSTLMRTNYPHAVKESTTTEYDASVLLTRATAADLAHTILSRVSSDGAAARLAHVSPRVFLHIFIHTFAPAVFMEGCPSVCSVRHESLESQHRSTKICPMKARHQFLTSCTRLLTLVCKEACFREALVEGKVLIYVGDMLKALLEIQFPLIGTVERIKREDELLTDNTCRRPKTEKTPCIQPKTSPTAVERGKEILLQQLVADDDESKKRKAFFHGSLVCSNDPKDRALLADDVEDCRGDLLALVASLSLSIEAKRQCTEHFLLLVAATCFLETKSNNLGYALQIIVNVCENPNARQKLLPLLLPHLTDMHKHMHTLMTENTSSFTYEELELCRLQRCCKRAIDAVCNAV